MMTVNLQIDGFFFFLVVVITLFLFTEHSLGASPKAECGKHTGYRKKAGRETGSDAIIEFQGSQQQAPYVHG